jgi:hypothetical protein
MKDKIFFISHIHMYGVETKRTAQSPVLSPIISNKTALHFRPDRLFLGYREGRYTMMHDTVPENVRVSSKSTGRIRSQLLQEKLPGIYLGEARFERLGSYLGDGRYCSDRRSSSSDQGRLSEGNQPVHSRQAQGDRRERRRGHED